MQGCGFSTCVHTFRPCTIILLTSSHIWFFVFRLNVKRCKFCVAILKKRPPNSLLLVRMKLEDDKMQIANKSLEGVYCSTLIVFSG